MESIDTGLEERRPDARGSLEVIALATAQWRVRDASNPASDARSLLGFIGALNDVFEVVAIARPQARRYFDTFDGALASLTEAEPTQSAA